MLTQQITNRASPHRAIHSSQSITAHTTQNISSQRTRKLEREGDVPLLDFSVFGLDCACEVCMSDITLTQAHAHCIGRITAGPHVGAVKCGGDQSQEVNKPHAPSVSVWSCLRRLSVSVCVSAVAANRSHHLLACCIHSHVHSLLLTAEVEQVGSSGADLAKAPACVSSSSAPWSSRDFKSMRDCVQG